LGPGSGAVVVVAVVGLTVVLVVVSTGEVVVSVVVLGAIPPE